MDSNKLSSFLKTCNDEGLKYLASRLYIESKKERKDDEALNVSLLDLSVARDGLKNEYLNVYGAKKSGKYDSMYEIPDVKNRITVINGMLDDCFYSVDLSNQDNFLNILTLITMQECFFKMPISFPFHIDYCLNMVCGNNKDSLGQSVKIKVLGANRNE